MKSNLRSNNHGMSGAGFALLHYMLKNLLRNSTFLILIIMQGFAAFAETHAEAKQKVQYLLAVDRLDFYTQNLADFLDGKKSPELINALRGLKPEDFYSQRLGLGDLENPKQWQNLIYHTLTTKNPNASVNFNDLEWNYDFFKNKLVKRFAVKDASVPAATREFVYHQTPVTLRSVPYIKGDKILLDTDRYIAEKTSRAIVWDGIMNNREFSFFVGTQTDFQEALSSNKLEVVAEVQPMANNYNKIYLIFDPKTQKYSYAMNLISGDDRIKHLSAQLRLIKFAGKSYLSKEHDKVRVYGSATDFHKRQEAILTDLFKQLPKADKIVIGQKGAIEDVIKTAGMKDVVAKDMKQVMSEMNLDKSKQSKFVNLMTNVNQVSAFTNDLTLNGALIDEAYEKAKDPIAREYAQFNSEQASHEFTDYLLLDTQGQVRRWRVFSAIWGDEVLPIARALKNSGAAEIVYIGTAGAIANRGLKVGDVIAGGHVYTHSGKKLDFSEGTLASKGARPFGIGQVYTPFDETNKWLETTAKNFDAVEVETGYLREELGDKVNLQAYFLISDVVGSEGETLAHAAQSASKRKRGQLKLLESLFVQNNIASPISNYTPMPMQLPLKRTLERLKVLRPSRDELSLLQVARLAQAAGKSSNEDLEALLKSQPTFTRADMTEALMSLGSLMTEIQPLLASGDSVRLQSNELFNGSFNPKKKITLKMAPEGIPSKELLIARIGQAKWAAYEKVLSKYFDLQIVDSHSTVMAGAKSFRVKSADSFFRSYENDVLKSAGFAAELDKNGQYRLRGMPGVDQGVLGLRCEGVFL